MANRPRQATKPQKGNTDTVDAENVDKYLISNSFYHQFNTALNGNLQVQSLNSYNDTVSPESDEPVSKTKVDPPESSPVEFDARARQAFANLKTEFGDKAFWCIVQQQFEIVSEGRSFEKLPPQFWAICKLAQALYSRKYRAEMSIDDKAVERPKATNRMRAFRANMTPEKAAEVRAKDTERKRLKGQGSKHLVP
jgi:hypothetical protein